MVRPRLREIILMSRYAAIAGLLIVLAVPSSASVAGVREQVRSVLLERINGDRARHDLPPVAFDLAASEIADQYCGRQIEEGTRGHFSTDGLPPYMRYSFAGLDGAVLENAAAWSAREVVPEQMVPDLALKSHSEMITEIPPNNGHRRVILDPQATHAGIGVSWGGGEVRIIEVFFRRHLEWQSKTQKVHAGDVRRYQARILDRGSVVEAVTVHHEPFPYRLSRDRANRIDSYALPAEWMRMERERKTSPLDAVIRKGAAPRVPGFRVADETVSFDLEFSNGRGIYTIVVWVRLPGESHAIEATNLSVVAEVREQGIAAGF